MRPLRFCQACGNELGEADGEGGASCPGCKRTWYRNMAPTVGAAIVRDGKALATIRAFEPQKGKLDVPGGFLRMGEDPIEGLKREVKEELDVEIDVSMADVVQMVPHAYGDDGEWVLSAGFKVRWIGGELSPADDVADVRWLTEDQIDSGDFAWDHDKTLLRRALEDE